jgi:hypothetical protein
MLGIVSALALAAGAGFALYSCDGFADSAAQAADDAADADRCGSLEEIKYSIRGPKGWADYGFTRAELLGRPNKGYVLGTDRTVRVKRYYRYTNDNLRKKLEAAGITVTGYHSTSKAGEWCWTEFNLKQITEFKLYN